MKLSYLPSAAFYSAVASFLTVVVVAYQYGIPTGGEGPGQSAEDYIPVFFVTVATILLLYIFLFQQGGTAVLEHERLWGEYLEMKQAREKSSPNTKTSLLNNNLQKPSMVEIKYWSKNLSVLAADRCAGNFQEQMIPFLITLYSYAVFVGVEGAAKTGWIWIIFRSYYAVVFKKPFPALLVSTMPSYTCIFYMLARTTYAVANMQT